MPADAFLDAALREEPSLLEHAFERNVVVATPSTLVALLRTVAYTWRQEALAANAAEVHQLGRELYQRLSTMGGHIDKLGPLAEQRGRQVQPDGVLAREPGAGDRAPDDRPQGGRARPRRSTLRTRSPSIARSTQAPELTEQRVVALPKPRVPVGQAELPTGTPEASGA